MRIPLLLSCLMLLTVTALAEDDHPLSQLQELIDGANDDSIITVTRGRYVGPTSLLITQRAKLTLDCEIGTEILVDDVNQHVVAISASSAITIDGALLRHVKPLTEYQCHGNVVNVEGCTGVTISNCDINGCGAIGVSVEGCTGVAIVDSFVHENTFNAFYLRSSSDIDILRDMITDNANIMQAYQVENLKLSDNEMSRNGGYWETKDAQPGIKKSAQKPRHRPQKDAPLPDQSEEKP
ncbi:MAG: right-handed parallel beta-helix repeat-containing protein [Planctomycetes bacterium]|nr:right-handed parallel beta-helix repeat-containing protein [Planctomycetota bacterium]